MNTYPTHNYHYIDKNVDRIKDEHLFALLIEIRDLRQEKLEGVIIQFLIESLNPFSNGRKKLSLKKANFFNQPILETKIRQWQDTEIYKFCIDLVWFGRLGTIENYDKTSIYVLLNKAIPDHQKSMKQTKRKKT